MTGYEFYQPRKWQSVSSCCAMSCCPRKYFYSSGCRLTGEEHPALVYGTAIHKALPELLTGDPATALRRALDQFNSVWSDELADGSGKRSTERGFELLNCFYKTHQPGARIYELEKPPVQPGLQVNEKNSDWEFPFVVSIPGVSVPFVGKIDGVCRHRDTSEHWCLEYKSTSELGQRFLSSFIFNPQVVLYPMACSALNRPVRGTIVEACLVAKTKADNAPIFSYVEPFHIEDGIKWLQWTIAKIEICEKNQDFPKDLSGCNPYARYGQPGYNCPFLPLCHKTDDWTQLKDMFRVKTEEGFKFSEGETVAD